VPARQPRPAVPRPARPRRRPTAAPRRLPRHPGAARPPPRAATARHHRRRSSQPGRPPTQPPEHPTVPDPGLAAAGVLASLRGPTDHGPGGTLVAAVGGTLAAIGTLAAPSGWNRTAGAAGTVGLLLALRGHAARRTRQDAVHAARPLRAASPLPPARDGAEHWRGVSPLLTRDRRVVVPPIGSRTASRAVATCAKRSW